MRSMKRVLSLLLVLAMVLAMVPSFAMAAESGVPTNGVEVTYADGVTKSLYRTGDEILNYAGTQYGPYAAQNALGLAMAAIKAAGNVGTATLYTDITVTDRTLGEAGVSGGNMVIEVNTPDANVVVDLNGHTISMGTGGSMPVSASSGNPALFSMGGSNSSLEVKNGTVNWAGSRTFYLNGSSSTTNDSAKIHDSTVRFTDLQLNYTGDSGNGAFVFNGSANTKIILDGGCYKMSGGRALATAANNTNDTTLHLTGGVQIWASTENIIRMSTDAGHTYIEEARVYAPNAGGATGAYFVKNKDNADVSTLVTLVNGNGGSALPTVTNGNIAADFEGTEVFCTIIEVLPEGAEKVAGAITAGAETAYFVNDTLQAPQNNVYPTVNEAFDAALDAAGEGVVLYQNIQLNSALNITKDLMLNLGGTTLTGTGAATFAVAENKAFTVTGGTVNWNSEAAFVTAASGASAVFDGGKYNLYNGLAVSGDGAVVTLCGEAELNTSAAYAVSVGAAGKVYLQKCTVYTADKDNKSLDTGMGIADAAVVEVDLAKYNPKEELNTVSKTYNGVKVYKKEFAEKLNYIKAAGFTTEDGDETIFYTCSALLAADEANSVYTTAENALGAALKAWKDAGAGTVTMYTDVEITDRTLGGSGVSSASAVFYLSAASALKLNLNGFTLKMSTDHKPMTSDGTKTPTLFDFVGNKLEVVNGNIEWGGDRTLFQSGSSGVTDDSAKTNGSVVFTDVNIEYNGGNRLFYFNNAAGATITFDGGSVKSDKMFTFIEASNDTSKTVLRFKGGVELWSNLVNKDSGLASVIAINELGHVYLEDVKVYTPNPSSDAGAYFVTNREASALASGANYTIGDGENESTLSYNPTGIEFGGKTVYCTTVKSSAPGEGGEGGEGGETGLVYTTGDVAGFKGAANGAVETIYGVADSTTEGKFDVYKHAAGSEEKTVVSNTPLATAKEAVTAAFDKAMGEWSATTAKQGTVTLYADVETRTTGYNINKNNGFLTLNLNGKTLLRGSLDTGYLVTAKGGALGNSQHGDVTINGGVDAAGTGKIISATSIVNVSGKFVNLTVNGATMECGTAAPIAITNNNNEGNIIITGGSVTASNLFAITVYGAKTNVTVQGGFRFVASGNESNAVLLPGNAKLTVGEATFLLGSEASSTADGYILKKATNASASAGAAATMQDGLQYVVSAQGDKHLHSFVFDSSFVAVYTNPAGVESKYLTVADAFAAVRDNNGGTVKLLKDTTLSANDGYAVDLDCGFTLDLNGKTLNITGNGIRVFNGLSQAVYAMLPAAKRTVNIISTAEEGKIISSGIHAVYMVHGDPVVDNVAITVDETSAEAVHTDAQGNRVAFTTVAEAIAHLKNEKGGTVQLLKDVTMKSSGGYAIDVNFGFTLDLNGKTLSTDGNAIGVFTGLTSDAYNQLTAEQKLVKIISTAEQSKIIAGGVLGVYTAYGEPTVENVVITANKAVMRAGSKLFTAAEVQKYLNSDDYKGDALTLMMNIPSDGITLPQLRLRKSVSLDMAGFTMETNISSTADLTLKNGTLNGKISAAALTLNDVTVNGNADATGITATNSSILGAVSVNGGALDLTNTSITSTSVAAITFKKAGGNHYIDGGTIITGAPITTGNATMLFVSGNAKLTAYNATSVINGVGIVQVKDAVVTFKNGQTPFDGVTLEGYRAPNTDVVGDSETIWTYVVRGTTNMTGMTAKLVENGTYFPTVAEALAAASTLVVETVQLIGNDTIGDYTFDKDVVLDLNGFDLEGSLVIDGYGIDIKNGKIASSGDAVTVKSGLLNLTDATVVASGNALVVDSIGAEVYVKNSELIGNTAKNASSYALYVKNALNLELNGSAFGSLSDEIPAIKIENTVPYGKVILNTGEILVPTTLFAAPGFDNNWADGKDLIQTIILSEASRYAVEYPVINPADGTDVKNSYYVFKATAPAATIGSTAYATMNEAIAAAKNGAVVVMQRDCDLDEGGNYLTIKNTITIDLNGYTLDNVDGSSYNQINGGKVTIKNGKITNLNTTANYTFMVQNNSSLYLENVDAEVKTGFVNSSSGVSSAYVHIDGGTIVSKSAYPVRANAHDSTQRDANPVYVLTGGVKLIREDGKATLYGEYTRYQVENAYVYCQSAGDGLHHVYAPAASRLEGDTGPRETGHLASESVKITTTTAVHNGKTYTVNCFSLGEVAYVGTDTEANRCATVEEALQKATSGQTVYLLSDAKISNAATVKTGTTLDLNGKKVTFGTSGTLTVQGTLKTNGGSVESRKELALKSGAKVMDENGSFCTIVSDAYVNTALNLQKVSLTMNDMVDMNLKFDFSKISGIIGKATAKVDGNTVSADPNNANVFVNADIAMSDYAKTYWVFAEAQTKDGTFIGMPKAVSVKEYATRVFNEMGTTSKLGYAMSALLKYAGVLTGDEGYHDENTDNHKVTERAVATTGNEIVAANDLANGFGVKFTVNVASAGVLKVTHTDVYGTEFVETFNVTNVDNEKTYTKIHMADYDQAITAELTVDGTVVATLVTSLGMVIKGNEQALYTGGMTKNYLGFGM